MNSITRNERIERYKHWVGRDDCEKMRESARTNMRAGREDLAARQHEKADEMYEALHRRNDETADFLRVMR